MRTREAESLAIVEVQDTKNCIACCWIGPMFPQPYNLFTEWLLFLWICFLNFIPPIYKQEKTLNHVDMLCNGIYNGRFRLISQKVSIWELFSNLSNTKYKNQDVLPPFTMGDNAMIHSIYQGKKGANSHMDLANRFNLHLFEYKKEMADHVMLFVSK